MNFLSWNAKHKTQKRTGRISTAPLRGFLDRIVPATLGVADDDDDDDGMIDDMIDDDMIIVVSVVLLCFCS